MPTERMAQLIGAIGQMLAADRVQDREPIFLYAEARRGAVVVTVCENDGRWVTCGDAPLPLVRLTRDLWRAEPVPKRWSSMAYVVKGAKFNADFGFPEQATDPEPLARIERAVRRQFGRKPIRILHDARR